jgi:two-component system phosphate regulon response regulator PhoB
MHDRPQVLIVDSDPNYRSLITQSLVQRQIDCTETSTAKEALALVRERLPDLIIIDFYLPDQSGLGLCRVLRETPQLARIPLILVSAQASEMDRILSFEAGADDFLAKPFYPRELAARASAVIRGFARGENSSCPIGEGPVRINSIAQRAAVAGKLLDLTPTEFKLLSALVSQEGRVLGRRELIQRLWGQHTPQSDRAVDAHIKSIRRKLGGARRCIETIRGVGYRYSNQSGDAADVRCARPAAACRDRTPTRPGQRNS